MRWYIYIKILKIITAIQILSKFAKNLTSLLNSTFNFENDIGWGQFILRSEEKKNNDNIIQFIDTHTSFLWIENKICYFIVRIKCISWKENNIMYNLKSLQ